MPGFITYTTVGYGDLHPTTPAGKSVFVVWALLGVGGLTVLISVRCDSVARGYTQSFSRTPQVIAEAYAGAFSTAVSSGTYDTQVYNRLKARATQARIEELERRNAELVANTLRLDELAADLIAHARTYHPHVRHVYDIDRHKRHSHEEPSRKLKELLVQEMAGEDEMTHHVVLKHRDMWKVCQY